jgi:hypothetical protein
MKWNTQRRRKVVEEVVRELDVGLVDLVDQQDHALLGVEGLAHRSELDVRTDVVDVLVSEPGVVETLDRVVDVEPVLSAGRAPDVPPKKGHPEGLGHRIGQQGLAGAGLPADQEGPFEHDRAVDRGFEGFAREIGSGSRKTSKIVSHDGETYHHPAKWRLRDGLGRGSLQGCRLRKPGQGGLSPFSPRTSPLHSLKINPSKKGTVPLVTRGVGVGVGGRSA